ncbi:hypothetical protein EXIGLDRAFT_331261 [Exidia glandulosa HHB12029]|uniref:Secreted protein n=1 Tax=Exidia glandulosa HHB12029 TaxID=1314781 RepID=A0A165CQU2_EXIGL|nr:hypothetical protein EXIGLDRAFT_331261 [Exidia glandulosa HHB12029]
MYWVGGLVFRIMHVVSRLVVVASLYYSEAEAVFVGPSAPNLPTYLPTHLGQMNFFTATTLRALRKYNDPCSAGINILHQTRRHPTSPPSPFPCSRTFDTTAHPP